jgi:prepilin peptidase CpaA
MAAFFSNAVGPGPALLLLTLAVACMVTDLWKGRIYNAVTYPAIVLGFIAQIALHGTTGFWTALAGFSVGFFPAFLLFALGGLGGGDVKLLAAVGAIAGAVPATETLILSFLFGAFFGLAKLAWKGRLFATLWRAVRVLGGFVVPGVPRTRLVDEGERPTLMHFGTAMCLAILATLWDLRSGAISSWVLG